MNKADKISNPSDTELLRLHIAGDSNAFALLIKRYKDELFNFLARFVADASLADDIFQEAFLQLHISASEFDVSRQLKPWLFTIAANKARDALRSRSRRQAAPLDAVINDHQEATFAELMPSKIPPPDETAMNLQTRQAVQNIVGEMPETLRIVLLLNYFHDFSYNDIAEMLGVPLGTVKSRLHAAVKYFAHKWKLASERLGYDKPDRI